MWLDIATGKAMRHWIETVGGAAKISGGRTLDPFGSSMRNFNTGGVDGVAGWLAAVAAGELLAARGGAGNQAETDLRSARMLAQGSAVLTPLGDQVLQQWRAAGIDNGNSEFELPRCVIVVRVAQQLGTGRYTDMLAFWKELRALFDPTDLLASNEALYLPSYLSNAVDGFTPWEHLKLQKWGAEVPTLQAIRDIAAELPDSTDETEKAAGKLADRIHGYASREGRQHFCAAMELVCLAESDQDAASAQAEKWGA